MASESITTLLKAAALAPVLRIDHHQVLLCVDIVSDGEIAVTEIELEGLDGGWKRADNRSRDRSLEDEQGRHPTAGNAAASPRYRISCWEH